MKKCETCGRKTTNKSYEGDDNKYNERNCQQCAMILKMVDIFEISLNKPNLQGNTRKVKLSVKIE